VNYHPEVKFVGPVLAKLQFLYAHKIKWATARPLALCFLAVALFACIKT
jgi:hypothetical protein